jgi:hypothetical protein
MKKASVKKSLGIVGSVDIYFLGTYACIKDPSVTPVILGVLAGFVVALFGIKKFMKSTEPEV